MCFYIHQNHIERKIAKEDIICYKALAIEDTKQDDLLGSVHITRGSIKKVRISTPYRNKDVKLNSLTKSKLEYPLKSLITIEDRVNIGLHSFSRIVKKRLKNKFLWNPVIVFQSVIPKGSNYYYNPDRNEYVSDKLFIGNKIVWYSANIIINDKKLLTNLK